MLTIELVIPCLVWSCPVVEPQGNTTAALPRKNSREGRDGKQIARVEIMLHRPPRRDGIDAELIPPSLPADTNYARRNRKTRMIIRSKLKSTFLKTGAVRDTKFPQNASPS